MNSSKIAGIIILIVSIAVLAIFFSTHRKITELHISIYGEKAEPAKIEGTNKPAPEETKKVETPIQEKK